MNSLIKYNRIPNYFFQMITISFFSLIILEFCNPNHVLGLQTYSYIHQKDFIDLAVEFYKLKEYTNAMDILQDYVLNDDQTPWKTTALFLQGLIHYQSGDYTVSIQEFKKVLSSSPGEQYKNKVRFMLGNCYYRLGRIKLALREFLYVYNESDNEELSLKAGENASRIFSYTVKEDDLIELQLEFNNSDLTNLLNVKIVEKLIKKMEYRKAEEILGGVLSSPTRGPYFDEAERLLHYIDNLRKQPALIGLVLPIHDIYNDVGRQIYTGAHFAVEEFNRTSDRQVRLITMDSGTNPLETLRVVREMIKVPDILGILTSVDMWSLGLVILANKSQIPLVALQAKEEGIDELGDFTFLVNASNKMHARIMANYVKNVLDYQRVAVIAPLTLFGQTVSDTFTKIADSLGSEIVSQQWYTPGTLDFSRQFNNIRQKGFELMNLDSLQIYADSLSENVNWDSLSFAQLDSLQELYDASNIVEQSEKLRGTPKELDSLDIPVISIDGVLLVAEGDDVPILSNQFAYYNIDAQALGIGDWYITDPKKRNTIRFPEGIIFTGDYYFEDSSLPYQEFRNRFRIEMGKTPEKMETIAFDAIQLFLKALEGGAINRKELRNAMNRLGEWQGVKGRFYYVPHKQSNQWVDIFQYRRGKIIQLPH